MRYAGITLAIAAAFWAIGAQAQELPVRSGDHSTFSRLAIPVPPSQQWKAEQSARGVVITLPGFRGRFDATDVFVRMQRNRISGLTTDGNVMTLELACDCDATAFRSGQLLVIDVADAGTTLAAPALQKRIVEPPAPSKKLVRPRAILPWIGGNSPFATPTLNEPQQTTGSPISEETHRTELLIETQKALIEGVANAASAGLLENSYRTPEQKSVSPQNNTDAASIRVQALPDVIVAPTPNMRVTSSMDTPSSNIASRLNATTTGAACPKDDFLAVHTWGDDNGFSAQIGPARNALMDARDNLDITAAKDLAQLYIFFGFGAEAHAVLRLDPDLTNQFPHLAAVAQILEHGAAVGRNTLGQYADCDSDVALWASLSFETIPSDVLIDTNAALRALNKLPKHLRQVLAPSLSNRLLQYGDSEAAAVALRSIERLPDAPTPSAVMAQAELAIDAGEPAEAFLEKVIETNSTQSPEALIKLVRGKLARDEPLSLQTATLVEAYVQELRGTQMGNTLRQTQIIALGQAEQFAEAFDALVALAPSLSPKSIAELSQIVLEQLSNKADDFTFLEHVFAQGEDTISSLERPTKLLVATRLMKLGFAAQVQQILATIPDRPRTGQRQILAARAALGLRQPFQAQAALIGIDDPEAALLLAQAKEMAGSYREASEIFAANDAVQQAAQAAWLSDEWRDLMPTDTVNFGPVATLVQAEPPADNPSLGPLGLADRALEESRAARSTLEQLLQDPSIQIAPDS